MEQKTILVIAGTDSSGGAGLTRDTSTACEHGVGVLPVVTAVTAQTHRGLIASSPISAEFVRQQLDAASASTPFQAVKIGMLGTAAIAAVVAEWLASQTVLVVLDPVGKTSSGGSLFEGKLPSDLLAHVDLLTPNLPEAADLSGQHVAQTDAGIAHQAAALRAQGAKAALIKGGHGRGAFATNHLFDGTTYHQFSKPRLQDGKRGTGCTLATAIACNLAKGLELDQACRAATDYVHDWMRGQNSR